MGSATVIGCIGLGGMGEPICANLLRKSGCRVRGFDLRPAPRARLEPEGLEIAVSAADAARGAARGTQSARSTKAPAAPASTSPSGARNATTTSTGRRSSGHPPGTNSSYQPHLVREFTGSGVFRIRNEQVNRCLEPVSDGRGEHVVANVCSGAETQLWRTQNTVQFASVALGGCLAAVDGSYSNGNWLHITNCTAGRADQNWRVVR